MSEEEIPEIDWAMLREGVMNLAEIAWTYHQACIGAGFTESQALALTISWQTEWMRQARA